jgi:ribosomal protein S18 acetylase RimI-like enzyme
MQEMGNFQWTSEYPTEFNFQSDIANENLYVAVTLENKLLGVCAITTDQGDDYLQIPHWKPNEISVVPHRLAVHPDSQGRGVARALLSTAEKIAMQMQIKQIRVDTNSANIVTTNFFPKLGYKFVGEINLAGRLGRFSCYEKNILA